jgi:hypothetical protein
MKKQYFLTLGLCLLVFASCGEKSEITPLYEAKTLEQMNANKMFISFPIEEIDIENPTREFEEIPVIGGVLRNLADALANLTFKEEYFDLNIAPQTLSVPEIEKIDFSYFKKVELDSVMIEVVSESESRDGGLWRSENESGQDAHANNRQIVRDSRMNLDFIQDLEIYIEPVGEVRNNPNDREGSGTLAINESDRAVSGRPDLLLSYKPSRDTAGCQGQCLLLKVHRTELRNFLASFSEYKIHTRLKIKKVPEVSMKVKGTINLVIEYDPGF